MKRRKLDVKNPPRLSKAQKARLHSLTEEEINAAALSDPDALPLDDEGFGKLMPLPNPKRVRKQLGMSQRAFAETFHLNFRTLQDWEQGRRVPDASTRILLALILNFPQEIKEMVEASLATSKSR